MISSKGDVTEEESKYPQNSTLDGASTSTTTQQHMTTCRCGCIPTGIPSLFEMAERRKRYLQVQRENQATTSNAKPS